MADSLYLFTNDLRLLDNTQLQTLVSKHQNREISLRCAYCIDPRSYRADNYDSKHIGRHRLLFDLQSIQDIASKLLNHGIPVDVQFDSPASYVLSKHELARFDAIYIAEQFGWNEEQSFNSLKQQLIEQFDFPETQFVRFNNHTLFNIEQLPFALDAIPSSFTKFRKAVELLPLDTLFRCNELTGDTNNQDNYTPKHIEKTRRSFIEQFQRLINRPEISSMYTSNQHSKEIDTSNSALELGNLNNGIISGPSMLFEGGEQAGQKHLKDYFSSNSPSTYKETRNALDDWPSSTKFSPWLANGSISAKHVWHTVIEYENTHGANDSTYWIKFELLWREYFQWQAKAIGNKLFWFSGTPGKKPLTSFYPERFNKWCKGQTPYPIVNAAMHQLNTTGYMSNRARQLVASCFIHELGLDWRYGAAYFQQQLVDYDVASNWGNWQYLAGVGFDPRGSRQFNLQKQTQIYDPNLDFINKWQGDCTLPLDSVDMADWPQS